tara:strand:- start:5056 stop:5403 length:348 start_codon:yes stop_codon:yes gene_type:complete
VLPVFYNDSKVRWFFHIHCNCKRPEWAPAIESIIDPRNPPKISRRIKVLSSIKRQAETTITILPIILPMVPISVIPPEVPFSTFLKLRQFRGEEREKNPISVAHVSAAAAATEEM